MSFLSLDQNPLYSVVYSAVPQEVHVPVVGLLDYSCSSTKFRCVCTHTAVHTESKGTKFSTAVSAVRAHEQNQRFENYVYTAVDIY